MIEPLLLTTARVSTFAGKGLLTCSSGFFFEREGRLFLVTSRHVMIDKPSGHFPDRIEIELHRRAGLGSRGRERFTAIADWRGGKIAREAKALLPSACVWAGGLSNNEIYYSRILSNAVRTPDPFLVLNDGWVLRRLSPFCSRIELSQLPRGHDEEKLLRAMGRELANVHFGTRRAIAAVRRDLSQRKPKWLRQAAEVMAHSRIGRKGKNGRGEAPANSDRHRVGCVAQPSITPSKDNCELERAVITLRRLHSFASFYALILYPFIETDLINAGAECFEKTVMTDQGLATRMTLPLLMKK